MENPLMKDHAHVTERRAENSGVKVVTTIFGATHFILALAAEAVTCAEAGIVSKMTKNDITYSQMKNYRLLETTQRIANTKDKCKEFENRMKKLKAEAQAKMQEKKNNPEMQVA